MRALRIPIPEEPSNLDLPPWMIDGARTPERPEAPRLELPLDRDAPSPRAPEEAAEPLPGSTVIVIPL